MKCPCCGSALKSGVTVDLNTNTARNDERLAVLTAQQADILAAVLEKGPKPVPMTDIVSRVWGVIEIDRAEAAVRVQISRMRPKLAEIGIALIAAKKRGYYVGVCA